MLRKLTILVAALLLIAGASAGVTAAGVFHEDAEPQTAARPATETSSTNGLVDALQRRLEADPSDGTALTRLATVYLQKARETADPTYYAKAEQALQLALAAEAENAEAMRGLGELALARHRFAEGLAWAERGLAIEPVSAAGYGVRGDALIELGRYDEAMEAFQQMVDLKPDLNSLARVSYTRELMGDTDGAIEAMRAAAEAGGGRGEATAWARAQLGDLYFNTGDLPAADAEFRRSLEALADYVYGIAGQARVAAAEGEYDDAIEYYAGVIERIPAPEFIIGLGDVYRAAGREAEANEQYELIDVIDRLYKANGVNTDLELALFYADHDLRLDEALQQARAGYAERPTVHAADVLAWVLFKNGRFEEAQAYSNEALRLGTQSAQMLFHVGMISQALGDNERAAAYLREAVETNPHFSLLYAAEAQRVLGELGGRGIGGAGGLMLQRGPSWRIAGAALAALAALMAFGHVSSASKAEAHPLGNFTVNRYSLIALSDDGVDVRYIVDMAEIPAFIERKNVDTNGDGQVTDVERAAYAEKKTPEILEGVQLVIDGEPVALRTVAGELSFPAGEGGLETLRLVVDYRAALADWEGSAIDAEYQDDNARELAGWHEVVVQAASGARLLESSAPAADVSDQLRAYPQDLLSQPVDVSSATFRFEAVTTGAEAQPDDGVTGAPVSDEDRATEGNPDPSAPAYADLIIKDRLTVGVVIVALLTAVGFGALHALSPGHGKTVVAAYLVGARGTWWHAVLLALTVTVTHTSSVYALGFTTLYFSEYILPEDLYPWLGIASGVLILAMGLSLLAGRLYSSGLLSEALDWVRRRPAMATTGQGTVAFANAGVDATHEDAHDNATHSHGFGGSHSHVPAEGQPVSYRSLIGLGIFGGLLPCPSAIIVMLGAVALDRVAFGLLLVVAFSAGLAIVLTAVGVAFVYAGRLPERVPLLRRLADRSQSAGGFLGFVVRMVPVASAAVVVVAGLVITAEALELRGLL